MLRMRQRTLLRGTGGEGALKRDGIRCEGRQPWEPKSSVQEPCPCELVAVQRGATGNYIAKTISALDIPEERPPSVEAADKIRGHLLFAKVVADNGGPLAETGAQWIAQDLGVTPEAVLAVAAGEENTNDDLLLDLKDGEWAAFLKKLDAGRDGSGSDFVVDGRSLEGVPGPPSLINRLGGIGQVRRVREVRALRGFRRHDAEAALIGVDLGVNQKYGPVYPAVELFGEGIFLRFDEAKLAAWEAQRGVQARAASSRRAGPTLHWPVASMCRSPDSWPCTHWRTCSSDDWRSRAATRPPRCRSASMPTPTGRTRQPGF